MNSRPLQASPSGPSVVVLAHTAVAGSRAARRLRGLSSVAPVRWLYLGRDFDRLLAWEASLASGFVRVDYAERLQDVAGRLRRPFLEWMGDLGQAHDSFGWWISKINERNTFVLSLFHKICYLEIARHELTTSTAPLLVVADSLAVLRAVADQAPQGTTIVRIGRERIAIEPLVFAFRFVSRWLLYLLRSVHAHIDSRTTRGRTYMPAPTGRPRVLIHSCLDETYFGADLDGRDRYFTVLPAELRARGYDVITIPWLCNIRRSRRAAFKWFRARQERFLIPEDFCRLRDYLWAAWMVVRHASIPGGPCAFVGRDVTTLVAESRREQYTACGTARFVRYMRFIERLKRIGFEFDVFIDTFENMIPEKPPVMALRHSMPDTLTVGFQHFMTPLPLLLNMVATAAEAAVAPHPDIIVCNSPWTKRLLSNEGLPSSKLRVGPSLRYLHLMRSGVNAGPAGDLVVAFLPIERAAALELIVKLREACGDDPCVAVRFKPHPMMPADRLAAILKKYPLKAHMSVVGGRMEDWLPKTACAVAAATTSALEVALCGVPLVLVGRATDLDINPMAWFADFPTPVYSSVALREAIRAVLADLGGAHRRARAWADEHRQECLSPLTDATIRAFIEPVAAAAVEPVAVPSLSPAMTPSVN